MINITAIFAAGYSTLSNEKNTTTDEVSIFVTQDLSTQVSPRIGDPGIRYLGAHHQEPSLGFLYFMQFISCFERCANIYHASSRASITRVVLDKNKKA